MDTKMTYVFIGVDVNGIYKAYGDDPYKVADDLDLPSGNYRVYKTTLMPDQIKTDKNIYKDSKLFFIMDYMRTAGA